MDVSAVVLVGAVALGAVAAWPAARAVERASESWRQLRAHVRGTRRMWRRARRRTGDAVGTLLLAVAVLVLAGLIVWSSKR